MIYRTYECTECNTVFEVHHDSSDDPVPDCPSCSKVLEWRPKSFNMTGHKSKAVDLTQKIMEEDYGMTNFKDNSREGDIAAMMPVSKPQEDYQIEKTFRDIQSQTSPEQRAQFWGQSQGTPTTMGSATGQSMIQMAKVGPQGDDPMAMLHTGVKSGNLPTLKKMTRVIAKADMT